LTGKEKSFKILSQMSCFFSKCRPGLLALTLIGSAQVGSVTAGEAPKASQVSTNETRRNGLKDLEERLSKSFQPFSPKDAIDSSMTPHLAPPLPQPRVMPNKRTQEEIDRQKNWMFMTPEDLAKSSFQGLLKPDEAGNVDPARLSTMEKFYDSLGIKKPRKDANKSAAERDSLSGMPGTKPETETEEKNLPAGLRETQDHLRKLLGQSPGELKDPLANRNSFIDLFKRDSSFTDRVLNEDPYVKQYREFQSAPAIVPGIANPLAGAPAPGTANPYSTLPSAAAHGDFTPTMGAINPTFKFAPQDLNAKVLNGWNPLYTPAKPEPPKTAPSMPSFEAPRRRF
jgi:hypothetical protein